MNPAAAGADDADDIAAQDVLASIWQRVLRRGPVGPDGDLFLLGGSWFDAARASSLIRDAFEVDLTPAELAAAPTPAGLAPLVEGRCHSGASPPPEQAVAPVAVSQEGMVWHEQLVPGSFNLAPLVRRQRGRLDHGALSAAFEELTRRHEPLRASLQLRHGRAVQVVGDATALRLPVLDLSSLAQPAAETHARKVIAEAASTPFDLAAEPLFQPQLIRFGPGDHLLVVRLHHTVFDDWSVAVYRRELSTLYASLVAGREPSLPQLPSGFSGYARRQRRHLAGPAGTSELTWWQAQLDGAPLTTQLDIGDPDGRGPGGPSDPVSLTLAPELAGRLRALATHGRATLFMTLLAGFQVLLHRRTGQDDLVLASVVANRNEREVEGLIGCFTKKVLLRLRRRGDPTFLELLAQVRDNLLGAMAHGNLGFETVLQETLGHQAAHHGVVAHVPIMFQGLVPARAQLDLPGLTGSIYGSAESQGPGMHVVTREATEQDAPDSSRDGLAAASFLGVSVVDHGNDVTLLAQGGFHGPAVQALLAEFDTLLADIVSRPLATVTDLMGDRSAAGSTGRFDGFALDRHRLEQASSRGPGVRESNLVGSDETSLLTSAWAQALGVPRVPADANYWLSFSFLEALTTVRETMPIAPEQVARNRTPEMLAADLVASRTAASPGRARQAATTQPPHREVTSAVDHEVIRAEGLGKTYPNGVTAVDALDLSVRQGEIFGLLGPNGAGKTTTVGMLTTLVLPTAGRAFVGGVDVVADPALAKQYLGVVPQVNNLDYRLTVVENLYFHGRYFGMSATKARARAAEMLDRFRLAGRGDDKVEHLSGGMLRRLQLARAFMHGPAVAFLDEPTAGLDPQSRLALWDIVAGLRAEGQTVLLTTHYMEEAERSCDRVAIMDAGRILALDTPDGLKRSFASATVMVVQGHGDFDRLARRLAAFDWVREAEPAQAAIRIRLDRVDGALSTVMAQAEQAGVKVIDVSVNEDNLETVFVNLTGRELRE